MFAADKETYKSLQLLEREIRSHRRPLVVWVGAGPSAWAGYPLWNDLADSFHSTFARTEHLYDAQAGAVLISEGRLPKLFQLLKDTDSQRYFTLLTDAFKPHEPTAVLRRFLGMLGKAAPAGILTTNVDETLERHISGPQLLQRSDFERAMGLLTEQTAFICKLHGSISAVQSTVFTEDDYAALTAEPRYISFMRQVFANAIVVFLGYSVRDDYVLQTLVDATSERELFGAGAHYVVCAEGTQVSSGLLRPIRYINDAPGDHRACAQVLDVIACAHATDSERVNVPQSLTAPAKTVYFIADLVPPGTWKTSQVATFEGEDGVQRELIVGGGYIDGEVKLEGYSALHDVVVGLLCFDRLVFPLDSIAKVHDLLGSQTFWQLLEADAIGLVHSPVETGLVYPALGEVTGGDLASIELQGRGSNFERVVKMTIRERIDRALKPAPGKKEKAERLLESLATSIQVLPSVNVPAKVRGALMHPSVRRMLGVSGGVSVISLPRWVAFPVLRLAHVVATAEYCQHVNAVATRLLWGSERLAGAAFAAAAAHEWADDAASYILTGRFNTEIGAYIAKNPATLTKIMLFRTSQAGESFRKEIADRLSTNSGGELVASINLGLKQAIPASVLESAREHLSGLLLSNQESTKLTPAVWGDLRNGDSRIAQWRVRSGKVLAENCTRLGVGPYDPCPCGSGEKLRFCCQDALRG